MTSLKPFLAGRVRAQATKARPMTNSTAASGNTLGLVIMGDNRIGMI